jgi:hypothetical protein
MVLGPPGTLVKMTFEKADRQSQNVTDRFRYDVNLMRSARLLERRKIEAEKARLEAAVKKEMHARQWIEERVQKQEAEIQALRTECEEASLDSRMALRKHEAEVEALRTECEEAKVKVNQQEADLEALRTKCGEAMSKLVQGEVEKQRLRKNCEKLEREIELYQKKLAETEKDIEIGMEHENLMVLERKEFRAQRSAWREEKAQAQKEVELLETKVLETSQKLDEFTVGACACVCAYA